jgi:hypothetical protein
MIVRKLVNADKESFGKINFHENAEAHCYKYLTSVNLTCISVTFILSVYHKVALLA